jgi:hypothetical protein
MQSTTLLPLLHSRLGLPITRFRFQRARNSITHSLTALGLVSPRLAIARFSGEQEMQSTTLLHSYSFTLGSISLRLAPARFRGGSFHQQLSTLAIYSCSRCSLQRRETSINNSPRLLFTPTLGSLSRRLALARFGGEKFYHQLSSSLATLALGLVSLRLASFPAPPSLARFNTPTHTPLLFPTLSFPALSLSLSLLCVILRLAFRRV